MKRLKKQSNQTFEHATTFGVFINICNDNLIKPYSETNKERHSNSLDENSVYLSKHSGQEFAIECIDSDKYGIGLYFELNVNEKNLLPSHDFKEFTFPEEDSNGKEYWLNSHNQKVYKEDELTWEDSISINDECRYNGSISLNNIISVTFFTRNQELLDNFSNFNTKLSLQDAIKLKDEIINYLGI